MRVLVIGGTHFIGPHVVTMLHQQGHEVTVYHRGLHESQLPSGIRHVHDPQAAIPVLHFPSSLSDPPLDVVIHMFPVGEDDTKAAIARFTGVTRRIVALSSGDVYLAYGRLLGTEPGPPQPVPLDEDAPLRKVLFPYRHIAAGPADWMYHYEKILAERALLGGRLPATVLRLPAVYGPSDPYRRLRPFIKRIADRRPAILLEAAQAAWRWTHGYVEDVALAIASVAVDDHAVGKVYNLGEANAPTMAERVQRIGQLMDWSGNMIPLSREELPQHLHAPYQPRQHLVLDTRRIRTELRFDERVPAEEALRRTIVWEGANPPESGDPGSEEYAAEDAALSSMGGHVGLEEPHS
jgi:nucleoside-diphosphate-sugar epimerase